MVDARLFSYIQQQMQAGYGADAIRNYLLQNRYPQNEVDAALQAAIASFQKAAASPQQAPVELATLVNYFKQYIQQGYSADQIQNFLLQNRYPPDLVAVARKKAFGFQFPRVGIPSKRVLLIAVIIFLIAAALAGTAWFFMNITPETVQEVDFDTSIAVDVVAPGDTLYINNDFINFPEERLYSITIYYTINERETLTRADSWQVSVDIADSLLEAKSVKHPILRTMAPGDYELNVKMSYGITTKQVYAYFTVSTSEEALERAEEVAVEKEALEDSDEVAEEITQEMTENVSDEMQQEAESEEPVDESVEITKEAGIPTSNDYMNLATAKEVAKTDATAAAEYCVAISTLTQKDECYWNVAKNSGDKSYCESVVADHTRDACWVGFAFDKADYTVCDNISNPFIKQSCEQLEKVAELQAMQGG